MVDYIGVYVLEYISYFEMLSTHVDIHINNNTITFILSRLKAWRCVCITYVHTCIKLYLYFCFSCRRYIAADY